MEKQSISNYDNLSTMESSSLATTSDSNHSDQVYFKSYEDLDVHRLMLDDSPRTLAYKRAVESNAHLFKGKRVLDIGAGTGILSLFAAAFGGASKVYAVEASNLAQIIPYIFSKNGYNSDRIQVLHSKVEDLSVDKDLDGQKVDIIISEWMGFYLLHESMIQSVLWGRDNLLDPDTGLLFPEKCEIFACPVNVPELWSNHSSKNYWGGNVSTDSSSPMETISLKYGFDFSPIAEMVEFMSQPKIDVISHDNLLSEPQLLWTLDLKTVTSSDLKALHDRRFMSLTDDGDLHGVAIWWTCTFPGDIELSTAPWEPPTHWKQLVVLLPESPQVEVDEIIGWNLSMLKDSGPNERSYKISLELIWDPDAEHPVPCSCGSVKCEIIKVYMSGSTDNPSATEAE